MFELYDKGLEEFNDILIFVIIGLIIFVSVIVFIFILIMFILEIKGLFYENILLVVSSILNRE